MDMQKEVADFELVVANKLQNKLFETVYFNKEIGWYDCDANTSVDVQVFCHDLNCDWLIWKSAKAQAVQEWISVKDQLPTNVANTGNRNTGNWNTGNHNTGNRNTGDHNTGNFNIGDLNIGDFNIGDHNTGNHNTGNRNTGNWNTSNHNTGNHNTGNRNTGNHNTGNLNTGNHNTGYWNTTNFSNGFFNTKEVEIINAFDKPCMKSVWDEATKPECLYFSLTKWICETEMSDVEKQENPSYSHTGGYLKSFDYKEAFTKSVTAASKEERDMIRALPNFDADIFLEISGVDLRLMDLE